MTAQRQAPLPSAFHRHSTADDVLQGIDVSGKNVVVTGGYSGLGLETTRAFASRGATVWVPARRLDAATSTLSGIEGNVHVLAMDLADLDSVRAFAATVREQAGHVDILINNAGIMACPETRVGPGWESQFAINHLGHALLTQELLPALLAADAPRVVCLSSTGHMISPIRWEDTHFTAQPYNKWVAYGQAKTANSLFAIALDDRYKAQGLRAFAVHPGGILTPLQRHLPQEEMVALGWIDESGELSDKAKGMFKSTEAGAATAVWCATSPALADIGGVYCEDCDIASPAVEGNRQSGVRDWAVDPEAADKLWDLTQSMLASA